MGGCEGVDECLPPQQPELSLCPPVEPELPGQCEPELPSFMKDIMDKELAIRKTKKDKKLKKKPKSTTKQNRISKKLSKSTTDNSDSKILYNYQEFHKGCFRLCNQNRVEAYDRNMMKIAIQEFNEDDITSKEFVERITYVCGGLPKVPTGSDVYQMLDDGLALKRKQKTLKLEKIIKVAEEVTVTPASQTKSAKIEMTQESVDECLTRQEKELPVCPPVEPELPVCIPSKRSIKKAEKKELRKSKKSAAKQLKKAQATEPELPVSSPIIQIENEGVDECLAPQQPEKSVCPPTVDSEVSAEPELPDFMKQIVDN